MLQCLLFLLIVSQFNMNIRDKNVHSNILRLISGPERAILCNLFCVRTRNNHSMENHGDQIHLYNDRPLIKIHEVKAWQRAKRAASRARTDKRTRTEVFGMNDHVWQWGWSNRSLQCLLAVGFQASFHRYQAKKLSISHGDKKPGKVDSHVDPRPTQCTLY